MTAAPELFRPTWRRVDSRWGSFLVLARDYYVGRSLMHYGEFSPEEVGFLLHLVKPGDLVVDAGANVGALTVPLAQAGAHVVAIEPQPEVFELLAANVAACGVAGRVELHNVALGALPGTLWLPALDYGETNNFGGVSLFPSAAAAAAALPATAPPHEVPCTTLDALLAGRTPRLIKADVEGMEPELLRGARATLAHQPALYLEADRADRRPELEALLREAGYAWREHRPPLYSRHNFFRNPLNLFGAVVSLNLYATAKAGKAAL